MLVIRLYKCTGKEDSKKIDGFRWLEKKKTNSRVRNALWIPNMKKCIALPLTIHIRKKMPWMWFKKALKRHWRPSKKDPILRIFEAWFFRILLSVATDYWRKKKREAVHIEKDEHVLALLNNPQRSFLEIEEIINQLDSPNREIILLKFFEGFTLKEIALILDINENTIKTKMYRSLNELRSLLN